MLTQKMWNHTKKSQISDIIHEVAYTFCISFAIFLIMSPLTCISTAVFYIFYLIYFQN